MENLFSRFKSLLLRLTGSLTHSQKYLFMVLILVSAFFLLVYEIAQETNEKLELLTDEADSLSVIAPLRGFYENVSTHHQLIRRYLAGEEGLANEIGKSETAIRLFLMELDSLKENEGLGLLTKERHPLIFKDLINDWELIENRIMEFSPSQQELLHHRLENNIIALIDQISTSVNPETNLAMAAFQYGEALYTLIPEFTLALHAYERTDDLKALYAIYLHLKLQLEKVSVSLKRVKNHPEVLSKFDHLKIDFETEVERYFQHEEAGEKGGGNSVVLEKVIDFWQKGLLLQQELLEMEQGGMIPGKYVLMIVILILLIIAYFLGHYFLRTIIDSIQNLDSGFRELSLGNLSARVPVFFNDEIGRASKGFNRMAEKLEVLNNQLHRLFNATKQLVKGDFSARVVSDGIDDPQSKEIAISFNLMANSIERILTHLKSLGANLTLSVNKIASISKNYEGSTSEQEKTIDNILRIASDISQKSKEFQVTIDEVHAAVKETSTLANESRDGLALMEDTMSQMVTSVNEIASRLSIMNEKASNVNNVIMTILKVTDQTNLLSLKAAIEAEKADESGRNFSAIASAIRDLADQTALATADVEKSINAMMSAVNTSVMGMDEFSREIRSGASELKTIGNQLVKIIRQVQLLGLNFISVNQGMDQQTFAARQIHVAINRLGNTAHTTAKSIHQFHITAEKLSESASVLLRIIP